MSAARLFQGPAEGDDLAQAVGHAPADRVDQLGHELASLGAVGFAVGGDHPLVDAPGGLDLDVVVVGEQLLQAVAAACR